MASLIVNAGIFAAATYLGSGAAPPELLVQITDWVASFVVTTILFAFIFKVLPTVPRHWGDVIPGAVLTSLLFTAGKLLLAVYLGNVGLTDTYGTASSFVVVLIWVYYSALVLFGVRNSHERTRAASAQLVVLPWEAVIVDDNAPRR